MKVDSFPIAAHVFVSLSTHQKDDVTQIPPLGMANKYPQTSRVIKIKCSLKKETANGYCWTKTPWTMVDHVCDTMRQAFTRLTKL